MAQAADMSTEAFENFYFEVCTLDYAEDGARHGPAAKTDGPDGPGAPQRRRARTCNSASRASAPSCAEGDRNIPDGEVFSCPVKDSVQRRIQYNTPTLYSGTKFENVRLEFKDGKIVERHGQQHQAAE